MLPSFRKIPIKLLCLFLTALLLGCTKFSEEVKDPSAGINGGFEVSKKGLPVNWLMYTPNTVPNSKFEIILDKEDFKQGKQSLKFQVEECISKGGWRFPGFANQFEAEEGGTYAIGEIFLVVIGILIALQINNWNENRKERDLEQRVLTNLKQEFESMISLINLWSISGQRSTGSFKQ